ncbi:ESPR domain-containing protein [Phascolarctobacterium succinatutens]|nr:ESPR domain-containing protein [Phascolarctobacterium succinatutens]
MNKVFKVIWREARNAYVVVSEMAKSHGTKKLLH